MIQVRNGVFLTSVFLSTRID